MKNLNPKMTLQDRTMLRLYQINIDPDASFRTATVRFMGVAETYEKEMATPTRKGSFVIDLMDITKATYAQAS